MFRSVSCRTYFSEIESNLVAIYDRSLNKFHSWPIGTFFSLTKKPRLSPPNKSTHLNKYANFCKAYFKSSTSSKNPCSKRTRTSRDLYKVMSLHLQREKPSKISQSDRWRRRTLNNWLLKPYITLILDLTTTPVGSFFWNTRLINNDMNTYLVQASQLI